MVTQRKRARILKPSENPDQQNDNEVTIGHVTAESLGYEQIRDQRIKENKLRMQSLGILDLSLQLKSELPSKRSSRNTSDKRIAKPSPLPPSEPSRKSSRLESMTPVSYAEIPTENKRGKRKNVEISIPYGTELEIYNEAHYKLLGDCKTSWTLAVDGYENGKRIYDENMGKSCHQCRQKTLGRRTNCSKCTTGHGLFCGDCLYMRYGENVIEVNKNPSWICPVCRGICNCSLCRKAKGWAPTGNLYRKVLKLGFKSVAHYLVQTRCSQPISDDGAIENPVSGNEAQEMADTGPEDGSLDEYEGSDGSR